MLKSKVADARELLEELVAKEEAEKEVAAAMRTGNQISIAKAIAKAKESGVDAETLEAQEAQAEDAAASSRKATRDGRAQLLEEMDELPFIDRMHAMEPIFGKLNGYDRVRSKEMSLSYSKIPIKKPMTKFFGKDGAALAKRAVSLFVSVLGYMGERKCVQLQPQAPRPPGHPPPLNPLGLVSC
eukprot:SAG22_NODE_2265_length_2771_cov_2.301647_4_plen_184_part_00